MLASHLVAAALPCQRLGVGGKKMGRRLASDLLSARNADLMDPYASGQRAGAYWKKFLQKIGAGRGAALVTATGKASPCPDDANGQDPSGYAPGHPTRPCGSVDLNFFCALGLEGLLVWTAVIVVCNILTSPCDIPQSYAGIWVTTFD
jgi:hypothetical protein